MRCSGGPLHKSGRALYASVREYGAGERAMNSSCETANGVLYMLRGCRGREGKGRFEKRVEGLLAEGAYDNEILRDRLASPEGP